MLHTLRERSRKVERRRGGYRSPGEFEQEKAEARSDVASGAAMMTFLGR
jgi:hypothetical protein